MNADHQRATTPIPALFPLLVPVNEQFTEYSGYLTRDYHHSTSSTQTQQSLSSLSSSAYGSYACGIHFEPSGEGATIHCSPELMQLLSLPATTVTVDMLHATTTTATTTSTTTTAMTFYDLLQQRLTQVMSNVTGNSNHDMSNSREYQLQVQQQFMCELREVLNRIHQMIDYRMVNNQNSNMNMSSGGSHDLLLKNLMTTNNTNTTLATTTTTTPTRTTKHMTTNQYKQIIANIDEIGWDRIVDIDTDLNHVTFVIRDGMDREHEIYFQLKNGGGDRQSQSKSGQPQGALSNDTAMDNTVVSQLSHYANLPIELVRKIQAMRDTSTTGNSGDGPIGHTMSDKNPFMFILRQYETVIDQIQDFLSVMHELDSTVCILEPENCTPAHTMRRIAVGSHSSIQIEVDPLMPYSIPNIRFLGADAVVGPMKESWMRHVHTQWKQPHKTKDTIEIEDKKEFNIVSNLERALNIKLPRKDEMEKTSSEFSGECGVCYAYKGSNDKIPDKVCDNVRCCMPFHSSCLVQWLRALPDVRQIFDTLTGKCPYCQEPIHVKSTAS